MERGRIPGRDRSDSGEELMSSLMALLRHPWTIRIAQIAIGIVFVVAALAKIPDIHAFAKQVGAYEIFPVAPQNLIAMVMPWIEVIAGLALIVGVRARAGAVVALMSMVAFTVMVAWAWGKGLSIDCGCFGTAIPKPVGPEKLFQNFGFTALAAIAVLRPDLSKPAPSTAQGLP